MLLQLSHPDYFGYRSFGFPDGELSGVMFMHPDAVIGFPKPGSGSYRLSGTVVTDPAYWDKEGDGVGCSVGIRIGDEDHVLWHSEIDGKNNAEDRSPKSFEIVIPETASLVWFKIDAGSKGDYRYDGMGWGNLQFRREP